VTGQQLGVEESLRLLLLLLLLLVVVVVAAAAIAVVVALLNLAVLLSRQGHYLHYFPGVI
jgi:hypothetical protein